MKSSAARETSFSLSDWSPNVLFLHAPHHPYNYLVSNQLRDSDRSDPHTTFSDVVTQPLGLHQTGQRVVDQSGHATSNKEVASISNPRRVRAENGDPLSC